MRIAQVAPLAESVPPKLYGGTERVVSWLTEELVSLGHDVTLFATGDSVTSAQLVPVGPRAIRLTRPSPDPAIATAALLEAVAEAAHGFDVIHWHLDWVHLPLLQRLRVPFLTTLHGRRLVIEAMACGTPVITWPRGSVPEVIEDGVTGFIVESEADAVAAIGRARCLDRGRFVKHLSGGLVRVEWPKHTLRAIKLC